MVYSYNNTFKIGSETITFDQALDELVSISREKQMYDMISIVSHYRNEEKIKAVVNGTNFDANFSE
jgi:hypothetical protein